MATIRIIVIRLRIINSMAEEGSRMKSSIHMKINKNRLPQINRFEAAHICKRKASEKSDLVISAFAIGSNIWVFTNLHKTLNRLFYFLVFFGFFLCTIDMNNLSAQGMNLTGLEKTWEPDTDLDFKKYKKKIDEISILGYMSLRLPVDLEYYLEQSTTRVKKRFLRLMFRITRYINSKHMDFILVNFNHHLKHENYISRSEQISDNWLYLLEVINYDKERIDNLYIEIANEPNLYPNEWDQVCTIAVEKIRAKYKEIPLIIGATNFNSIYELSRMEPLKYDNIIYSFHFYEPFIFTHQGTSWTGIQNATINIPFPYTDSIEMPELHPEAKGTSGEINYRDYRHTGTTQAINDKLEMVKVWCDTNNVKVWCTEYGVTTNADYLSRLNYLKQVRETLQTMQIKGFVWEFEGNFGISELELF